MATGETTESPPINPHFHLERVEVDPSEDYSRLTVEFRWDGEGDLFGVSYRPDDDFNWGEGPDGYAMSIKVALEENLLAVGYTLAAAVREPRDGIVWVHWDGPRGLSARLIDSPDD